MVRAATALAHRDNDADDNGITVAARGELKLTNRQMSIVARAMTPVMREVIKAEIGARLNADPGGHLHMLIGDVADLMRQRGAGDDPCRYDERGHHCTHDGTHGGYEDEPGDDLDLDLDDDDEDNNLRDLDMDAMLKSLLSPKRSAG